MGLCVSGNVDPAEKKRNQEIDKQNQQDFLKENQVQKLLLLGAGESGKSTLFKQIVDLYGKGFTEEEYMEFVPIIFANTINAMQTLLKYGDQFNEEKGNTQVSPSLAAEKQFIQDLPSGQILTKEIADAIVKLWADPGVKNTYELRSRFQLAVAADYFFSHAHEFAKDGWIPNKRDILQCRVRTTGIMETTLVYEGFQIKLVDVGGQRNERKKWIHSFENVQGLIFVAAISEYDQMLFEDDTVNRMTEALSIYAEIVNSKWFAESSMILFLNKSDLFREKIQKVPLTVCFPEYDGPANDYEAGWRFIAEEFLSKRENKSKDVYVQVTCATDDSNVTFVFNAVRDIVIQRALKKSGLMG